MLPPGYEFPQFGQAIWPAIANIQHIQIYTYKQRALL